MKLTRLSEIVYISSSELSVLTEPTLILLVLPRNFCSRAVGLREKRNSMSSLKPAHKLRQSRRYAISKSLLGSRFMSSGFRSSGKMVDRRSAGRKTTVHVHVYTTQFSILN